MRARPLLETLKALAPAAALLALGLAFAPGPALPSGSGDAEQYLRLARHLAADGTLAYESVTPSAHRMPMFPGLLALAAGPDGEPPARRVRLLGDALVAALAALTAALARSAGAGLAASAAAGLLVFLHPSLSGPGRAESIEPLFALCVAGVAWSLAAYAASPGRRAGALLGAVLGASLWCRSTLVLLPALLPLAARGWRRGKGGAWLAALLALAALAPWTARNLLLLGSWTPLESRGGAANLFAAAHGATETLGDDALLALAAERIEGWRGLDSSQRDRALLRGALREIAADPMGYGAGCLRRLGRLWKEHWFLAALAAAGFFRRRRSPPAQALALCAAYFSVHAAMAVNSRFLAPAVPLLAALAALAASPPPAGEAGAPAWRRGSLAASAAPLALAALAALRTAGEVWIAHAVRGRPGALCPSAWSRPAPWLAARVRDPKRAQDQGVLLYGEGRPEAALDCFRAALALEPRYEAPAASAAFVLEEGRARASEAPARKPT